MDDHGRWLRAAAEILNAPDSHRAHALLVAALRDQTHAGLVTRVALSPCDPDFVAMSVEGHLPYPPRELWPDAEQIRSHPLNRYHSSTRDHAPVLMPDVLAAGWVLDPGSKEVMVGLGITEQQLSIPVAPSGTAFNGWVLIAEERFDSEAAEQMAVVQGLVVGLDRHVRLLERARSHLRDAPDADAVALTPREQVVLVLISRGHTVQGMGQRLGISPRTVHKHQENLYRKLGAVDRLSAVLTAQRLGILPVDPEPPSPLADVSDAARQSEAMQVSSSSARRASSQTKSSSIR